MVGRNSRNSFRNDRMMPKLNRGRNQSVALLLFLLVITTMFSGCLAKVPDEINANIDAIIEIILGNPTRKIVESAIESLNRQPGMWEDTMKNTIDELGRVSTKSAKEILAEVQLLYSGALGQTGGEFSCRADFIGLRVEQRMEAILHKLDSNTPEPKIVPVICSIKPPDHIDAGDPGKTMLVTYYGYDFLNFSKNHTFTADLQYGSGDTIKQNFGFVNIPHNYELVLDIQAADYSNVDRTRGPAVVLKWGDLTVEGEGVKSELPVLMPTPPPPPPPLPDLVITDFALDPPSITLGSSILAKITVTNQGGGTAGEFYIQWKPTIDKEAFDIKVQSLNPGESRTYSSFPFTNFPAPGKFKTIAIVDPKNEVLETREDNNMASGEIEVSPNKVIYTISVLTADEDNAGTNCGVYTTLFGEYGQTDETKLDNRDNNFEGGQTDTFDITDNDIGDLWKIHVRKDTYKNKDDPCYDGPDWYLDRIIITNTNSNSMWTFKANRWFRINTLETDLYP